jgi:hypothetical protein
MQTVSPSTITQGSVQQNRVAEETHETAEHQQQELNESQAQPSTQYVVAVHPMKKSKHDFQERPLPPTFIQRFSLNYNHQPEVRDPFFEKLGKVFSKNSFTIKGAIDALATDEKFSGVNPEEIEQRLYSLIKFGHILEV